jgi:ribosomal protein S18 acetylase RimI-like enzyme
MRPVRLSDTNSLAANCWPQRSFALVYDLVQRAEQAAAEGRGLGVVVTGQDATVRGYGQFLNYPTCGEISDMVVAHSYQGLGYGTAIIQTLARAARAMGVQELEIGAALSNPRAAALYRRLGFEDSHSLMLDLGNGKERVIFLRLNLQGEPPE